MLRLLVFAALLLSNFSACGGKSSPPSTKIDGHYVLERTLITTFPVARTAESPGLLQESGRRYAYDLTVAPTDRSGKVRVTTYGGCSFIADEGGANLITAADLDCDPLTANSPLWVEGVENLRVLVFTFDRNLGTLREYALANIRWPDVRIPNSPIKNYSVGESHTTNLTLPMGTFHVKYDGTAEDSVPQPDAAEQAAAPGCTKRVGGGPTSGSLFIRYGQDKNELVIYEEGVGCTVQAKSIDGVVYSANETDCEFGDFGVNLLGVTRRHYSSYSIDLGNKTWSYSSTDNTSVNDIPQCLQATSQLSGDLPH